MTADGPGPSEDRDGERLISRAARTLARDPRAIASAVRACQTRTGMSDAALAAWLGLSVPRLHALAVCTKPHPGDPTSAVTVEAIAHYIGCDPERRRELLDAEHPAALSEQTRHQPSLPRSAPHTPMPTSATATIRDPE